MKNIDDKQTNLIRSWYVLQQELAELKNQESELRKLVMAEVFEDERMQHGTHKARLSDEAHVSLTIPKKIDVDIDAFNMHKDSMMQRGLIGDDSLIKLKPSVSASAIKYLNDEDKAAFGDVFKISTGSPQMKVVIDK